jgi:hypothetical protein
VRDDDHGSSLLIPREHELQIHDLSDGGRVEVPGRLIHEKDVRIVRECAGDRRRADFDVLRSRRLGRIESRAREITL